MREYYKLIIPKIERNTKMKNRFIASVLTVTLAVSLMAGCTKDHAKDPAESGTTAVSTTVAGTTADSSNGNAEKTEEEIKAKYEAKPADAAILAAERTAKPIKYSGFTGKFFETAAKTDEVPLASVTPIYSNVALKDYIQKNSDKYDFTYGVLSFSSIANSYPDSYFGEKALLVVSFKDSEGGSGYKLTGAWDEHMHVEDNHLDQLILAVKKSAGTNKCGHMIVEIDSDFLSLWDSISISLYE